MSSSQSDILTNSIAIFMTLVGAFLWDIIIFLIWHLRYTSNPISPRHHETQMLLRHGSGTLSFAARMLRMIRPFKRSSHTRCVPLDMTLLIILAVLIGAGTTTFSIISAWISVKGEVLLLPQKCGEPNYSLERFRFTSLASFENLKLDDFQALFLIAGYATDQSLEYSRNCYSTTDIASNACNTFVKSTLHSKLTVDVPCPFGDNICRSPAISITSPMIDTSKHLGFNNHPSGRVSGQKVLTCAPIDIERYSTDWAETSLPVGIPWDQNYISATTKTYYLGERALYDNVNYTAQITNFSIIDPEKYISPYSILWVDVFPF
jgi:hypothetical protein